MENVRVNLVGPIIHCSPDLTRVRIMSNIIERGEKMKKKVLIATPYIAGVLYLIYCLANINYWVKSHLGFGFYVLIPWFIAVLLFVSFIVVRILTKKRITFYLPLFFLIVGLIINIVGSSIPCCVGG